MINLFDYNLKYIEENTFRKWEIGIFIFYTWCNRCPYYTTFNWIFYRNDTIQIWIIPNERFAEEIKNSSGDSGDIEFQRTTSPNRF